MTWTKPLAGVRWIDTYPGDTLQDVAARELGDAARWTEIAAVNGLAAPYLADDPAAASDTVAQAGRPLRVPAPATATSGIADSGDAVFGQDIRLVDGSLQTDGAGDLATVAGIPNLVQAILIRLTTRPGDLLFHPAYGCPVGALLGGAADPIADRLAAGAVASALRAEPRIARTESVTASIIGDRLSVEGRAIAADGRRLPFRTA